MIRLACDVTGRDPQIYLSALGLYPRLFRVETPNRHFTGEFLGVWFENGCAEVGEQEVHKFLDRGFRVTQVPVEV